MRQMLLEIKEFFSEEKIYLFLLVFVLFFYLAAYLTYGKMHEGKRHDSSERIESAWQKIPSSIPSPKGAASPNLDSRQTAPAQEGVLRGEKLKDGGELWKQARILLAFSGAILIWSMVLNVSALRRWLAGRELIRRADRLLHISWGIRELIKVGILFFWFGIILNLVLSVLRILFFSNASGYLLIFFHTFLLDLLAVWFMVFHVRKSGARVRDLIGFELPQIPLREVWLGISAYVTILPAFFGMLIVLVYAAGLVQYEPPPHPLVNFFLEEKLPAWLVGFSFALACVVGPVVEEIFFRGFFYPVLRKYWGMRWAMVVTAGLFAAVHENAFSFFPIFFLGLALCYLYEKRKNLTSCISLHIAHNVAFIAYFFLLKNLSVSTGLSFLFLRQGGHV